MRVFLLPASVAVTQPLDSFVLPLNRSDLLAKYGVRLKIIGRKNLLPPELQEAIRIAEELTQNNDRYEPGMHKVTYFSPRH